MKYFLFVAVVAIPAAIAVDHMLAIDPNSAALAEARREEVSSLESTLHSMEHNQEAVIKSNKALEELVNASEQRLHGVVDRVAALDRETRDRMNAAKPFSLLQTKAYDAEDDTPLLARAGPKSALEAAKARAAASEKKFQEAMKKLQADKEGLIKDENFRRARAAQERRHIHI